MNRILSWMLLAAGAILIIYGVAASKSLGSDVSRLFTGAPTHTALWLLIGGIVAAVAGLAGLMGRWKT